MTTLKVTPTNQVKLSQAETAWRQLLDEALQRGFHGSATLEVVVQDGTIQHIRRKVERMER